MSAQGVVGVRIGGQVVPLLPEIPVDVAAGETPEHAVATVRCNACGAIGTIQAPVTYNTHDDDHFGRFEQWYRSRHAGACAGCGASIDIELSYTLTRYITSGRHELSLDAGQRGGGGMLVPSAGIPVPAGANPGEPAPQPADSAANIWLTCLDVDPARNRFAVGCQDGTVILADLASGRPQSIEKLHGDMVSSVSFDGQMLWTSGCDGQVVCWDLVLREERRRFDAGHGRVLRLRPAGGDRLLTVGDDGNARLWDKAGGAALQTLEETRFGAAYSVAAPAGWIAIGYQDGHVGIWVPAAAGAAGPWAYDGQMEPSGRRGSTLNAISVSPAGDLVAFARERRVTLCTPGSWKRVAELETDLACNDLHFDSKGEAVIGACSERLVRLWRRELVEPPGDRQRRGRRPMKPGARLMPIWNRFGDRFGLGMGRAAWEQTMIYSGARFAGDDQVIAVSFDGTVQLFKARAYWESPRVARFGGSKFDGWSE